MSVIFMSKIFHLHFTFYKVDMIVGVVLSFFLQDSVYLHTVCKEYSMEF